MSEIKHTLPKVIYVGFIGVHKYWGEYTKDTNLENVKYIRTDIVQELVEALEYIAGDSTGHYSYVAQQALNKAKGVGDEN